MARSRTHRRGRRSSWKGPLRLVPVFAVLLLVNAYFLVWKRGTSLRDLRRMSESHEKAAIALPAAAASPGAGGGQKGRTPGVRAPAPGPAAGGEGAFDGRLESGTVAAGDSLAALLRRAGVPVGTASAAIAALGSRFEARGLRAGFQYALRFDPEDRLRWFELRVAPNVLYVVQRGPARGASFRVERRGEEVRVELAAIAGDLDGSLRDGVLHAGEGPALAAALADALADGPATDLDERPGGRFRLVVEKLHLGDRFYRYGRLLAIELAGHGGTLRAFWFAAEPGTGGYYTEAGESLGRSPVRSPLRQAAPAPPADAKRLRPALRTEHGHLGSEWPAAVGAAVWATAAGKVVFRGSCPGEGECVVIAHPGGMETSYGHLARFARGLEDGQTVRRKQVIGYAGTSGLPPGATPRLRYAVRVGDHYVDPLHVAPVRDPALPASARDRFAVTVAPLARLLASAASTTRPPPLAGAPSHGAPLRPASPRTGAEEGRDP